MAVKFIDQNRKKEYSEEVLLRCACGCGFGSFRIIEDDNEENKEPPIVEFMYYGISNNDRYKDFYKANYMVFADLMAIKTLFDVVNGSIPSGIGAIQSDTGAVLEIRRGKDPDNGDKGVMLLGYSDAKHFKKFALSEGKKLKHLAWNLHLHSKEMNLFVETMGKLYTKYFKDVMAEFVKGLDSDGKIGIAVNSLL